MVLPERTTSYELSAGEPAPTAARLAIDGLAQELGLFYDDVRLLASELVTNSVRHAGLHAGDSILMTIWMTRLGVRVEVSDDGHGFDYRPLSAAPAGNSGWGLYLVSQLADRWGVAPARGGCVWFELDYEQDPSLSRPA